MGLFSDRDINTDGKTQIPVWFMRQAGRYHSHYQKIKQKSDFMTMCKNPSIACEVTMGPIRDFNFDAAILFSDLLFPLEQLGMGLSYVSGPPTLQFKIEKLIDLKKCTITQPSSNFYNFQKEATELIKKELPSQKSLLGFVGAPFTLYTYAVEGSHSGNLTDSKRGFYDGRFKGFCEMLIPELLSEMSLQAQGGADAICLFD
ncbi:MAG: uroporphyrinogen decarboxylase family protein, partial [Pseudomonadota bacterium]